MKSPHVNGGLRAQLPKLSHNVGLKVFQGDLERAVAISEQTNLELSEVLRRAINAGLPAVEKLTIPPAPPAS